MRRYAPICGPLARLPASRLYRHRARAVWPLESLTEPIRGIVAFWRESLMRRSASMSSLTGRSEARICKVNRSGGWGSGDSAYHLAHIAHQSSHIASHPITRLTLGSTYAAPVGLYVRRSQPSWLNTNQPRRLLPAYLRYKLSAQRVVYYMIPHQRRI